MLYGRGSGEDVVVVGVGKDLGGVAGDRCAVVGELAYAYMDVDGAAGVPARPDRLEADLAEHGALFESAVFTGDLVAAQPVVGAGVTAAGTASSLLCGLIGVEAVGVGVPDIDRDRRRWS